MDKHSLAYLRLQKHLKDFVPSSKGGKYFESKFLTSFFDKYTAKTTYSKEIERLLIKCCRDNQCYPAYCYDGSLFKLKTFTLEETPERFNYLYHKTDIPPEIILKEGIKVRYSFSLSKGFSPLVFLSNGEKNWHGKYTYKVKVSQKLYFNTNLNHKRRLGNSWFCVKQNIKPSEIELIAST